MIFISSTDTNVGKTYYSSELIQDLIKSNLFKPNQIAYYKPIQCGTETRDGIEETDFSFISKNNPEIKVFNSYFLKCPASPNYAAELENITIDINKIIDDFNQLKKQFDFIIVEGAGGLAVPINDKVLISDLAKALDLPLLLVIRPNLGTINHSLLSIEHANNKGIDIAGIVIASEAKQSNTTNPWQARDNAAINTILKIGKVELFDLCDFMNVIASEAKQSI